MRVWGKLIGGVFGLMLASPTGLGLLGLIVGIWVGSQFDAGLEKENTRTRKRSYTYSEPSPKQPLHAAYQQLGIVSTVSDAEVKRAYRRLMSQHHPDKLVAKGLPESMIKMATKKTQEIKAAYEKIKQSRGMR